MRQTGEDRHIYPILFPTTMIFCIIVFLSLAEQLFRSQELRVINTALQETYQHAWAHHACRDLSDPEDQYMDSFIEQKVIEPCIPMPNFRFKHLDKFVDLTSELKEKRGEPDTFPLSINGETHYLPNYFSPIYKSKVGWRSKARLMVITSSPYWTLALSILLPLPLWEFLFSSFVLRRHKIIFHGRDFAICSMPKWKLLAGSTLVFFGELALLIYSLHLPNSTLNNMVMYVFLFFFLAAAGTQLWIQEYSYSRNLLLLKIVHEVN